MGTAQAREASRGEVEPALEEILENSSEWVDINTFLQKAAHLPSGSDNYVFRGKRVWKVRQSSLFQQFENRSAKLGKPTRLFHGTSFKNAESIIKNGFQLPRRKGLHGAGIYFADNPRKSARYAPEKSWSPFFRRWGENGFLNALCSKSEGQVLLCDVYLGASQTTWSSNSDFDPTQDLKGGWFRQMFRLGDYSSVYAPGGWFSYSEYIVYEPHQALPLYLVEFEYA